MRLAVSVQVVKLGDIMRGVEDTRVSSLGTVLSGTEVNVGLPASTGSRKPNCARCRNHHLKVLLKGHKRYCRFKNCTCKKCNLTQERRVIMAKQTAERRRQVLDEDRRNKGLSVPPSPPPETPQRLEVVTATPAPSSPPIAAVPTTSNSNSSSSEAVPLESILHLLELFKYQLDTTSLLYIILRDVTPDIFDAHRRIQEAQGVLRAERGRRSALWPFYYQTQPPTTTDVYKPHSTLGLPLPWATFPYPYHPYLVTSSYNCEKKL